MSALPTGNSLEMRDWRGLASAEPTMVQYIFVAFAVAQIHVRAQRHRIAARAFDDTRVLQHVLKGADAPFHPCLLVLGVFILAAFADVAVQLGLLDAISDFRTAHHFQMR